MSVLYAFVICGTFCLIAEIIINHTKLTPGHVTSLFSVIGAILAFLNIYDKLIEKGNMGAIILISNFGNALYKAGLAGFYKNGVVGILSNMLSKSSLIICSTIIFSFIFVIFNKPRD